MPSSKPRRSKSARAWSTSRAKVGSIRIISGQHRGRKLPVLTADGLRPTTDRVKETLFNWLMHDTLDAKALDIFAGAGSLGFEALSRHASRVTFIEKDKKNAEQLQQNIHTLKAQAFAEVICDDALKCLSEMQSKFDLVFIDPPFFQGLITPAVNALMDSNLLEQGAKLYIESEASYAESIHPNLHKLKEQTTQQVAYRLFEYEANA